MGSFDEIVADYVSGLPQIEHLKKYYTLCDRVSEYNYSNFTIYDSVYSIDINSFNSTFLLYINQYIQSNNIELFIKRLNSINKQQRVIEFGLFFREASKNANISPYMVAFRNMVFAPYFQKKRCHGRVLKSFRVNYDDIEFVTLEGGITSELYVNSDFILNTKLLSYDNVIVLSRGDGIYYVRNNELIDIKYTGDWVNIPAYRFLIKLVIKFILDGGYSFKAMNNDLNEYIEFADNSNFFGYDSDSISKQYKPTDIVPVQVKYLFIAKVMSRFSIFFK